MTIINALPFNLQNGTTADATQVMANYNEIVNDVNTNAAHNGVNNDITALSALNTPIPVAAGATNVYVAGTSTGSGNAQVVAAPVPTGFTFTIGNAVRFLAGFSNTGAMTLNVNGTGATAVKYSAGSGPLPLIGGEVVAGNYITVVFDGVQFILMTSASVPFNAKFLQNYLSGLTLSTAGGSGTFGIAAGEAADTTNVSAMILASAYTKTTASWALGTGNGSLDTGAIANSTFYHVFLIQRPDTGVTDILTSLNAASPTLPTNYTLFRRIGSMKTDASAHWTAFTQVGDTFLWATSVVDLSAANNFAARSSVSLTVPNGTGLAMTALFRSSAGATGAGGFLVVFTSLLETDQAPTAITDLAMIANQQAAGMFERICNAAGQIGFRTSSTTGTASIFTYGWKDYRGK